MPFETEIFETARYIHTTHERYRNLESITEYIFKKDNGGKETRLQGLIGYMINDIRCVLEQIVVRVAQEENECSQTHRLGIFISLQSKEKVQQFLFSSC